MSEPTKSLKRSSGFTRANRREGHDLAGACIACKSSDAFRLHQQTGVGHCYSCQGKWSPFDVAVAVLGDRERAKALLVEMGVFQPTSSNSTPMTDPITAIARQKGITPESLRAFGAQAVSTNTIRLPAYGLPSIKLPGLPRMADFALWATAAETACGWPSGTFMTADQGNRESANEVALEASVVARPLLDLLEAQGEWTGASGELLKLLEECLGDQVRRLSGWPKTPRSLSGHLKRLAPNMRAAGWVLEQDRSSKKRCWAMRSDAKRCGLVRAGPR